MPNHADHGHGLAVLKMGRHIMPVPDIPLGWA